MEPRYSTKTRAKRIEPEYFKRLHPFRRWKLILSIIAPVVAAAWLVAYAARGDQRLYTSGPLSTGHVMFGTQCADCHGSGRATAPAFDSRIRDFGSSHPEFAVTVKEQNVVRRVRLNRGGEIKDLKDLAQIKLNHQKHLKVGLKGLDELQTLKGPRGILVKAGGRQLGCAFCHQPDASRASMQPISY